MAIFPKSAVEILAALSKLTSEDRSVVRRQLCELAGIRRRTGQSPGVCQGWSPI